MLAWSLGFKLFDLNSSDRMVCQSWFRVHVISQRKTILHCVFFVASTKAHFDIFAISEINLERWEAPRKSN